MRFQLGSYLFRYFTHAFRSQMKTRVMPIATSPSPSPTEDSRPVKRIKTGLNSPKLSSDGTVSGSTESSEAAMVEEEMRLPPDFSKIYTHELDYCKKLVLAPMVRTGSCELVHPANSGCKSADSQCQWWESRGGRF
jgi:hypothetical protein